MPKISRIYSLNQAHATLQHCRNRLTTFSQECASTEMHTEDETYVVTERQQYQNRLDRWEWAFTEYLSSAMRLMDSEDLTQCRVLKANHLACVVLASDDGAGASVLDVHETEFMAIVELAAAVLQSRQQAISPRSDRSCDATLTYCGLEIRDALLVVVARCGHSAVRKRANELFLLCCQ